MRQPTRLISGRAMLVLQKSDCLHVAALREAIAQSYINSHAADIAEVL